MREKLIELLNASFEAQYSKRGLLTAPHTADHLIANGVTIQPLTDCKQPVTDNNVGSKWIPVTEQEEPTENGTYLCHGYWFGSRRKQTETADFFGEWNIANNFILTHWMELPEPPKGE